MTAQPAPAPQARLWPNLALVALMLVSGVMLAWLSVLRYNGFNIAMLDLGNMAQSIASVLRGRPLEFTYKDGEMSRLALHVELIYFLFAPLYALWSDPRVLLIAQAALVASAAIPVYRLASRRLASPWAGVVIALVYLFYPVAQTALLFDFHGDTLAMPLLLWAVEAMDRRAWRSYAPWLALALACKFYVAAPVAIMGLVIWRWEGLRRVGLITTAVGLIYGAFAFLVIRPLFSTGQTSEAHRGLSYLSFYFSQFNPSEGVEQRLISALIVFAPALFLGLRGWRWLLPGLPIALFALLSNGPGSSFDYRYHHYAIAVPFFILAIIDGAARTHTPGVRYLALFVTALTTLAAGVIFVTTPLSPLRWGTAPGMSGDHAVYGVLPRDALKDRFLAELVPPNVPLITSTFFAPRLVNRQTLYTLQYPSAERSPTLPALLSKIDYALADALFDYRLLAGNSVIGGPGYDRAAIGTLLRDPRFGLVTERDGLLLFQRDPAPGAALPQSVELADTPILPATPAALGPVQLLGASIEPLGGRRYSASFEWQLSGDQPPQGLWVPVSRVGGRDDARIVHLPTYALLPPSEWQPGQVVRERFEIELPADLPAGEYVWSVAWYDGANPEALFTDARALPPGVTPAVVTTITLR